MTTINQDNIKTVLMARIQEKVDELRIILDENDFDIAEAEIIDAECPSIKDPKAWSEYFKINKQAMQAASLNREIFAYKETLEMDLMYCPCKFVVTDSELLSPAGFRPSERVFIQTRIAVHTNSLNAKNLPAFNVEVRAYNLDKAA